MLGHIVVLKRKLPHLAGQGAELVDGRDRIRVLKGQVGEFTDRSQANILGVGAAKFSQQLQNDRCTVGYVAGCRFGDLAQRKTLPGGVLKGLGELGELKRTVHVLDIGLLPAQGVALPGDGLKSPALSSSWLS